ncbi:hypothetical protein CEXT_789991, partial [Caerostris extrusa]
SGADFHYQDAFCWEMLLLQIQQRIDLRFDRSGRPICEK